MKLYIAGPMSGYPEHNWPAFEAAKARLERYGYEAVSPTDCNGIYEEAKAIPYLKCIKNDVRAMLTCDGVALLDGWESSQGVAKELTVAKLFEMETGHIDYWCNPIVSNLRGDLA